MLNGLDLFSGIGGIGLALKPWVRTICYCERDRYAQGVLLSRMRSGEIDTAPIWDDVQTLNKGLLPNVDIIFGGFPCQDISVAGNGSGVDGERSGLVFEYLRLIGECRPSFVYMENVAALAVRGLDRVLLGLNELGYDARWTVVSAAEVGAPHLRERIWILAHSNGERLPRRDVQETWAPEGKQQLQRLLRSDFWATVPRPEINRVDYGLHNRVDRIKCLGNSVVPQAAREAFVRLMEIRH